MSLLTKQAPIDPQDVPLNSLVAQEQVDVNFVSRNNFNNNDYRSNFGSNNPRPFPSNNYGNGNSNSYSQNYRERDLPSYEKLVEIEKPPKAICTLSLNRTRPFLDNKMSTPLSCKTIANNLRAWTVTFPVSKLDSLPLRPMFQTCLTPNPPW